MSKTSPVSSRRIPLEHIDQINSSIKNLTRVHVFIRNDNKMEDLFELAGESPVYISSVNKNDNRLSNVDISVGDYIVSVNGQNVSRALAKSVKKIIKSSNSLQMTLYRQDEKSAIRHNRILSTNQPLSPSKPKKINTFLGVLFSGFRAKRSTNQDQSTLQTKESLISSCIGVKSKHQQQNQQATTQIVTESDNDRTTTDCGYYSIPRTNSIPNTKSLVSVSDLNTSLSTSGCGSSVSSDNLSSEPNSNKVCIQGVISKFKSECDFFLGQIQSAIDLYVRPTFVLEILSIDECLELYQNIEKLIPVTKFMQSVLNSHESADLPNADLLKIVFDSFKTYLTGIPTAVKLLGELTNSNGKFVEFIDDLKNSCSFTILDLLFMPLNFVQIMVEFLKNMHVTYHAQTTALEQSSYNQMRFKQIIVDLYECSVSTHSVLEQIFEQNESQHSESNLNSYSTSSVNMNEESAVEFDLEKLPIQIKDDGKSGEWFDGFFWANQMRVEINDYDLSSVLDLVHLTNIKKSKNANLVYIKLEVEDCEHFFAIRFSSECLRSYIYEKIMKKYFC